jgi:hypothetical protein
MHECKQFFVASVVKSFSSLLYGTGLVCFSVGQQGREINSSLQTALTACLRVFSKIEIVRVSSSGVRHLATTFKFSKVVALLNFKMIFKNMAKKRSATTERPQNYRYNNTTPRSILLFHSYFHRTDTIEDQHRT